MGYVDRYYFGQCLIIVNTSASNVKAKSGENEWSIPVSGGKASFLLPPRAEYAIEAGNAKVTIYCGYGETKNLTM